MSSRLSKQSSDDIVDSVVKQHKECVKHSSEWREEAKQCYDMVAGHQWDEEDSEKLDTEKRPFTTFNRVAPVVDAVAGSEVNNRHAVQYIPRQVGDAAVNEMLTHAAKWVRDECNAEDEESDAFMDAIICGIGGTDTHIEYDEDPDGKICIDRVDPLEIYIDPVAKKKNLSDARFIQRAKRFAPEIAEEIWPEIKNASRSGEMDFEEDTSDIPHDATEAFKYENDQGGEAGKKKGYLVIEHQWYELEPYYRVATGEGIKSISVAKFDRLKDELDAAEMNYVKQKRRRYYRVFVCGDLLLEDVEEIDAFSISLITGKRDRNNNSWYGIVRPMIDPQKWANKFFSEILYIINTNAKGGLIAERTAFEDPRKAEEDWASPDSIVWANDGAITNKRLMPKPQSDVPPAIERLMGFAINANREVTGINLEFLGLAERDQPGVLEYQRKQAGLTILGTVFDSLRRYRKEQGKLLLLFINTYISDGRLIRIDSELGPQYAPLIRQPDTIKYDVIVDASPTSPNQKEMVFQLMIQLLPTLKELGIPITPDFLAYSPLPSKMVQDWRKAMAKPDPRRERAAEAQVQGAEAKVAKDKSSASLNLAKAQQLGGQQILDQQKLEFERAKAQEEADQAAIDQTIELLKAMKEKRQTAQMEA